MPSQLKKDSLDLYFASWYTSPLLYKGVKTIVAAWDISYSTHPEHYSIWHQISLGYFSKKSCIRANGVVTCSIFDAEQIHKHYKVDEKKICTIFLAADDRFTQEVNIKKEQNIRLKFSLPKAFILSLGAIYNRRNVDVIISAFAKIQSNFPDTQLLVIGKNRTNPKISIDNRIKDLGLEAKIIYQDWFDDEDLPDLYRAADYYICTSTVDGETIMLKEAMKSGTPVITSKLLEGTIGGNGYIIQDPESIDETADVLVSALSNAMDRKKLIEDGIVWNKQFSWGKVARETLDFIESR
jgi:glycosyltransferase involved in cell wall biosynthesis